MGRLRIGIIIFDHIIKYLCLLGLTMEVNLSLSDEIAGAGSYQNDLSAALALQATKYDTGIPSRVVEDTRSSMRDVDAHQQVSESFLSASAAVPRINVRINFTNKYPDEPIYETIIEFHEGEVRKKQKTEVSVLKFTGWNIHTRTNVLHNNFKWLNEKDALDVVESGR